MFAANTTLAIDFEDCNCHSFSKISCNALKPQNTFLLNPFDRFQEESGEDGEDGDGDDGDDDGDLESGSEPASGSGDESEDEDAEPLQQRWVQI